MGRRTPRTLIAVALCVALVVVACGDDDTQTTSTTLATETSTTTTTLPPEPEFVVVNQGDHSPVVRALQFLLVCNGYQQTVVEGRDETLVPDGVYGAITATIIDRVQRDMGLPRDGSFADADRSTSATRSYLWRRAGTPPRTFPTPGPSGHSPDNG